MRRSSSNHLDLVSMGKTNCQKFEYHVYGSEFTISSTSTIDEIHLTIVILFFFSIEKRQWSQTCSKTLEWTWTYLRRFVIVVKFFLCTMIERWFFEDLNRFRPVYSAKDFLDVICVLINPNLKIDESLWK